MTFSRDVGVAESTGFSRAALVVLGMHRSGTSAMAGVLSHMGCDLPRDLMPPTDANPKGYFESNKAYRLNDDLLKSGGSSWDDPAAFNPAWYESPRFPEYRMRAAGVLREEFGESGFFVLKDPRMCRLLPFWQRVLADLEVGARYVCIHRHPREVAASVGRREGWPETVGLVLWLRHVIEAEKASRGLPRVFVSYDGLLSDWRGTVTRIGAGLGLAWPLHPDSAAAGIAEFLSGELRHFRSEGEKIPRDTVTLGWVARAYEVLERWVADGEQAADHAVFDGLQAALDEASPLLNVLTSETRTLGSRLIKAEADLMTVRAESIGHAANHATEQKNRAAAQARAAELEVELRSAAKSRQDAEDSLAQMRSAFHQRDQELDELRHRSAQDAEKMARIAGELEVARGELDGAAKSRQDAEDSLAQMRSAFHQRDQELDELRHRSERDAEKISRLTGELEVARGELDGAAKSRQDAENSLAQIRSAFLQRGHELDELRQQSERDAEKISRLTGELEVARGELERLEQRHERDARHLAQMARQLAPLIRHELDAILDTKRTQETVALLEREKADLALSSKLLEERYAAEREAAAAQIASLAAEREAAAAQISNLTQERETAASQIASLAAERETAAAQISNLTQEREAAAAQIASLAAERDTLKPLEEKVRAASKALEQKTAELDAFRQAITTSTSWRLTAPLRGFSRLLRGR
ncbi:MAG: sulfotransferase [Mesorhizobium sp.]|nr:sulfotransferase [Mesorhizobium sp.]MCO5161912.1 sulfotransferase [Mesorhizobium sp.]